MPSTLNFPGYVKSIRALCGAVRSLGRTLLLVGVGGFIVAPSPAQPVPATSPVGAASATTPRNGESAIPRPPELARDVQFWIRVYSEIPTTAGFIHDERNLGVVYETLRFAPDTAPRDRQAAVDAARDRHIETLKRLAAALSGELPPPGPIGEVADPAAAATMTGAPATSPSATAASSAEAARNAAATLAGLSGEERRVLQMWGPQVTAARLLEATRGVRFQLGQADRFREGLIRSGTWETHIAQSFANLGLPPELAVLPHVESSFNPAAYSKVGAAGLWQFMRETGRRYMRVDDEVVDERLDPFRSTEAAAQLLAYNYRVLGTWPLALTAYNHGAAGMRRAVETVGTTDFVTINRTYTSRTFGFASRNFFPSFLAALTIDQNPEKYFGAIERAPELRFHEIEMPAYARIEAIERALGVPRDSLREMNPALRSPVWSGSRLVPRGYRLRLAATANSWTSDRLASALGTGELYAAQIRARSHKVKRDESLASIARKYGISTRTLAQLNGLSTDASVRRGRMLRLPEQRPPLLSGASLASAAAPPATAEIVIAPVGAPPAATSAGAPVTAAATPAVAPLPATRAAPATRVAASSRSATPTATTAADSRPTFYIVRGGDTLDTIARRFGLRASELMKMNRIRDADYVYEGQKLRVSRDEPALASATRTSAAEPDADASDTDEPEAPKPAPVREAPTVAAPAPRAATASDAAVVVQGPSVGPTLGGQTATDAFADLAVARDDTIRVISEETLGQYAEWLKISASRLRALNKLKSGQPVLLGRKLKLDFSRVTRADFEQQRRDFHSQQQAAYFENQRIVGTEIYIVRRGDSMWAITQRYNGLPAWLLQQYNPDIDLREMRAGTQIVVPRVQAAP